MQQYGIRQPVAVSDRKEDDSHTKGRSKLQEIAVHQSKEKGGPKGCEVFSVGAETMIEYSSENQLLH